MATAGTALNYCVSTKQKTFVQKESNERSLVLQSVVLGGLIEIDLALVDGCLSFGTCQHIGYQLVLSYESCETNTCPPSEPDSSNRLQLFELRLKGNQFDPWRRRWQC